MYENLKKLGQINEPNPLGIRFVGETICDEKFCIERSCSDMTSFEYIVDGYGTLEINGQILHPKKGDLFLITDGSSHKYYSQKENGWHKYFVSIFGDMVQPLLHSYLPPDTYLFSDCNLEKTFQRIFDIAFNNNDIKSAQTKIGIEVFKIFNYLRDRHISENEDFADKIKQRIESNIDKEFNLDNLCLQMNYSKNHLINIFSDKFGITPYQYYIDCKINMAKDYLLNTNMTIAEISSALSYSDQQYFSYCFKKATGYSPRNYRNNAKV